MSDDRIEALERIVVQLADALVAQRETMTAQAVILRAVVDLVALDDVRDLALYLTAGMPGEVDAAVRTLLTDPPACPGAIQ
ncbi:hypothetical protein [Methylobacterium sp. J-068]|uniref:hypothetical protein n=1 Tax=Methylobacterium sp. J-068 TaxID=2836649 RepID=UPI001FBB42EA|nr:hypothetical protein [Methylobacterium sp. J-068]MCJ2032625.1 hypothetical protein [Methylobacterium sp. J-068]